ncbi:MarR family transcriptional regulator [Acidisoma cellulosilytica]|uniref:MarR family transcriptional regulator n=1 Tax=Acidisoma cellulosilyticum TaxID=2802395 RepID=A0A963Z2Y7_9PROT|nr:MarR family transcriptional regulator [Acidisoma cellulosilyticum]MCB8881887.1 MarR family transcriptional regulator [Acidisoma cellulosilyticum]
MNGTDPQTLLAATLASDLRAIASKLKRRLREQAGTGDLTQSQIAVLLRLEKDGPATTSTLARAEGMRPQSMGAAIAPMEAAGLLDAKPDPHDGRQTILSLSDACRTMIREGRAARQDWLTRKIAAQLSPDEQTTLATAVHLLKRLVED